MVRKLNFNKTKKEKGYYYQLVLRTILVVIIPVLVISVTYYYITRENAIQQSIREQQNILFSVKISIENLLNMIETASLQKSREKELVNFLYSPQIRDDYSQQLIVLERLSAEKVANDFISEIFAYNDRHGLVISAEYGSTQRHNFRYNDDISYIMRYMKESRWVNLQHSFRNNRISYVRVLPAIFGAEPDGILVYHVDIQKLKTYFQYLDYWNNSSIIVFDSNNTVLLSSNNEQLDILLIEKIRNFVPSENETSAASTFLRDRTGSEILHTFHLNSYGRSYLLSIPKRDILTDINWVKYLTLIILTTSSGVAILLTHVFAKSIYKPIQSLIDYSRKATGADIYDKAINEIEFIKNCFDYISSKVESINEYIQLMGPELIEKALEILVFEGNVIGKGRLKRICDSNKIPMNMNYIVLATRIDYCTVEGMPDENRYLKNLELSKIMRNIIFADAGIDGYITKGDRSHPLSILKFNLEEADDEIERKVIRYTVSLIGGVRHQLGCTISIGVGNLYSHIEDLWLSHDEASKALMSSIYHEIDGVCFYSSLNAERVTTRLEYPILIEEEIISALEAGDTIGTETAFDNFVRVVDRTESYELVHHSYEVLLSSIVVNMVKHNTSLEPNDSGIFIGLHRCISKSDVSNFFRKSVFPEFMRRGGEDGHRGSQHVVDQVREYVMRKRANQISLLGASEHVNMSASHLSRVFKKKTGVGFSEYVIKTKIESTKKLLRETETSIMEISEIVGYSERNLGRLFLKYEKVTPGHYRKTHR